MNAGIDSYLLLQSIGIWLAGILPGVGSTDSGHTPKADLQWENADHDGVEQARAIEDAIEFTYKTSAQT
jgi:hypothetical protein